MVKTSGGAAAQCLGLMNAIYVSQKFRRPFKVSHYPYSTGTFFPLAIESLLYEDELCNVSVATKGLNLKEDPTVGTVIAEHPLVNRFLSYEKFLYILRKLRIYNLVKSITGENVIDFSSTRLKGSHGEMKSISGGFIPLMESEVMEELRKRFNSSGLASPFAEIDSNSPDVVIHYRLGDKRRTFEKLNLGIDGVVDPKTFRTILEQENLLTSLSIYVISDEPILAQELLRRVGIEARTSQSSNNIWSDIALMASAKISISCWSQVSQLAAVFNVFNGGKAFYANISSTGFKPKWSIPGATPFTPNFLPASDPVYEIN
jgi:hypothetical protein